MGPRRTNLALLVVLLAALGTGGLAFAAGSGWGRPVVIGHALAGLAVLVLAPWKSVIVRRGLARRSGPGRWASLTFGGLVLAAVAAGLAHATGALAGLGPVSAMQLHVGAALVAAPLLAWHTAARGGIRARRTDLSRRAPGRRGRRPGRLGGRQARPAAPPRRAAACRDHRQPGGRLGHRLPAPPPPGRRRNPAAGHPP
jgi:hypothetical protein